MTRWVAFVSVGLGASKRIPLSVLARNPHRGLAREISHETGRERWKEGPRGSQQKGAEETASWREQSREGQSRDKGRAKGRPVN